MRICLLGEFKGPLDEGMRKTSFNILRILRKRHKVLPLDLREIYNYNFWSDIRNFDPEIIHYLHGTSLKSFIILQTISKMCYNTKKILSIMQPLPSWSIKFISILGFKPDLVLTSSKNLYQSLETFGINAKFFPIGGVDLEKFTPRIGEEKIRLREKYGIKKDSFVILHVGPIKKERNVQILKELQKKENQVIIVGSTSTKKDDNILKDLKKANCIVWERYFNKIEEIYAMSDCYVFPTKSEKNAILLPLSVLEAMACNLPVITTKFGALPHVFQRGNGLFFVEKEHDFLEALSEIKKGLNPKTREKVLPYSWENLVIRLEEVYYSVLE
ncbi:MAG: glycosyltransferase family 4 protein [archaeon YNP-WB-062]|jgi:glycosyltransferase involved in cell wall biosynthesis|nr:glycosyltransferase family 4 protein [Candidatus Culexarchaeum yellowstonense]